MHFLLAFHVGCVACFSHRSAGCLATIPLPIILNKFNEITTNLLKMPNFLLQEEAQPIQNPLLATASLLS